MAVLILNKKILFSGKVVSGWKVTDKKDWNLIGKRSPQLPQMFYPVADSEMTLTKGDIVAARCTMVCCNGSCIDEISVYILSTDKILILLFRLTLMIMMCILEQLERMKCVISTSCIGSKERNLWIRGFVFHLVCNI